jgi:hypothetical protein
MLRQYSCRLQTSDFVCVYWFVRESALGDGQNNLIVRSVYVLREKKQRYRLLLGYPKLNKYT